MKLCSKCGERKPLEAFYRAKGMRDGRRSDCIACNLAEKAARYKADPEKERARVRAWQQKNRAIVLAQQQAYKESGRKAAVNRRHHLKKKHGITPEQYDELLARQGGGCAICGRPPREDISLHVDHDHATGATRGLLCFRCNNALGDFDDDRERLLEAVAYLSAHEVQSSALAAVIRLRAADLPRPRWATATS